MNKKLVILTTHFGKNFSGGSKATCEIFERMEGSFSETIVLCNKVGNHLFSNAKIHLFGNWLHLIKILNKLKLENAIFYGDFYNSICFVLTGIPFYFTYHDNWPELAKTSLRFKFLSFYYSPLYKAIFKKATAVFSVSEFKKEFINSFNKNVFLVRNGINIEKADHPKFSNNKILMVGNIDSRKYQLALLILPKIHELGISIDIYGNIKNPSLGRKLESYSFVNLHGYQDKISFESYPLLLHTSMMENISMVLCEAIYSGIPVLAFDVGGAREIIDHGNNGYLIKPFNIKEMARILHQIVSGKLKFNYNINKIKDFSWTAASKKYEEVILKT